MKALMVSESLTTEAVVALIADEVQVVRVQDFYVADACDHVAEALVSSSLYGEYVNAKNIGRVGMAFFEAASSPSLLEQYLSSSRLWLEQMRALSAPYLSPIDKLRVAMDETWPGGATLARLRHRPMFSGLIRVFENGGHAEPHLDNTGWDAEALGLGAETASPVQIAANVYLQVPSKGGELNIWAHRPDRDDFASRQMPGTYGLNVSDLPSPITIWPTKGELILFDSRRIHAVGSAGERRVTASTFITHSGKQHDALYFLS